MSSEKIWSRHHHACRRSSYSTRLLSDALATPGCRRSAGPEPTIHASRFVGTSMDLFVWVNCALDSRVSEPATGSRTARRSRCVSTSTVGFVSYRRAGSHHGPRRCCPLRRRLRRVAGHERSCSATGDAFLGAVTRRYYIIARCDEDARCAEEGSEQLEIRQVLHDVTPTVDEDMRTGSVRASYSHFKILQ